MRVPDLALYVEFTGSIAVSFVKGSTLLISEAITNELFCVEMALIATLLSILGTQQHSRPRLPGVIWAATVLGLDLSSILLGL